jgi:hypothetical protein
MGLAKPERPGDPYQLKRWRGDRDEREWPTRLLSQRDQHGQRWPWEPAGGYYIEGDDQQQLI